MDLCQKQKINKKKIKGRPSLISTDVVSTVVCYGSVEPVLEIILLQQNS